MTVDNMESVSEILPSVCPLDCPDTCSLNVEVKDDTVINIRGSHANPYTDGVICNKVMRSYPQMIHGAQRLTNPLKRTGPRNSGRYEEISWDEALDLVYEGFQKAIDQFGPQSVLPFNYAGPHGELAGGSMDRRFFYKLGATLLDRGPLCGGVRGAAYNSLFGPAPGMPPEQAVHSDLIVIWGNNVSVSNLHLIRIINRARANGAKIVVVDPKKIKVAEQADLHISIHPGTDVILAMAIAAELERREAIDLDFVTQWTTGFDKYMRQARQYDIRDVVEKCRISEADFRELVDLYCTRRTVAASFGNGIERGKSGGSGLRAAMALQALTGNHGRLGAGVIAKSGLAAPKTTDRLQLPELIPPGTRTFNIVDISNKLLDPDLSPPIMATMIYNHNPVCTHPDQERMVEALSRENLFIVGCDIVMTDSMKFADVILPASSHFEYDDVYGAYGQNYVQRAAPVISPIGESLPNTEIFRRLAKRFGFKDAIFSDSDVQLIESAFANNISGHDGLSASEIPVDQALVMKSDNDQELIMCDSVVPATRSGKIELFSEELEQKYGFGIPRYEDVSQSLPFVLISPSSAKRTNATFGGCDESDGFEVVEVNPADARDHGIGDGDLVELANDLASVILKVKISGLVKPGVCYSPKGTWLKSSPTGRTVNALIPADVRTDIADGACYHETFVDIRPA